MKRHIIEPYFTLKEKIKHDKNILQETIDHVLENISNLNPQLNAFCNVYEQEAREAVKNFDANKNLAGMIVGLKDVFCYEEHPLQASSKILENFTSCINATVTQRIVDNGGIIIGHQNCDEFAMGSSNETSYYGPVHNGLDLKKSPGGSSGGSAVSVQNDMCHVALGTDTGGSVRQPAAFCGIIGFKPTYGLISRYGVIAYASSFDTVGILGKTIEDIAILLENIAGQDEKDCTSSSRPVEKYYEKLDDINFGDLKVAYLGEALELDGLQEEVRSTMVHFIEKLREAGVDIGKRNFKYLDLFVPVYYVITAAEATSNLARFDGIRFGRCTEERVTSWEEFIARNRGEGFGMEVKKRILFGNHVLMEEGVVEQAQKIRRMIFDETIKIFDEYDFIILPTSPTTAFNIGRKSVSPSEDYLADIFTNLASVSGLPAISIPWGTDDNGLPIGMQIVAKHFDEQRLLAFSKKILSEVMP